MVRVALFTDEPVLAKGLPYVLSSVAGVELVSICDSTANLIENWEAGKPDVLLLDLTPEVSFGLLTELRNRIPDLKILLWVRSISTELAYQAMELGVRGILRKTLPTELLVKCLNKVAEGELWFEKTLTTSFIGMKTIALTKRESQLVSLLSQGLKNKEISTTLSISEGTVKVYLSKLFAKVGVKDRFELALCGFKNMATVEATLNGNLRRIAKVARAEPVPMEWPRYLVLDKSTEKVRGTGAFLGSSRTAAG